MNPAMSPDTSTTALPRHEHHRWLLDLTQIPTAAGREHRVIRWIRDWAGRRPWIDLTADPAGNLHLAFAPATTPTSTPKSTAAPVYFTAHLDHPAFVVERLIAPRTAQLQFRGGVMDEYFVDARVTIHPDAQHAAPVGARLIQTIEPASPGIDKSYLAEIDADAPLAVGDIATWELPPPEITAGLIHTNACDDLASLVAALAAFDELGRQRHDHPGTIPDVRLLLTRAEEIGFIGAIAACRHKTMPPGSRVIALEVSRSFDDSPIGGGPIVRVGDRLSVFNPTLTAACARRAEEISGRPATPTATQKATQAASTGAWRWQRKLMPGGACEASVFQAFGYESTCLCLPLGNYHNMADLAAVQAGTNTTKPRVAREFVSIADFDGLVDLLIACGQSLPTASPIMDRLDKLWTSRHGVLDASA